MDDFILFLILGYTTIAHLFLDSYEARTVNTRWITIEAVGILLLFCVMMILAGVRG